MFLSGLPSRKKCRTEELLTALQQQTVAAVNSLVDVQKQLLELKKAEVEMQREMLTMKKAKMACKGLHEDEAGNWFRVLKTDEE